MDLGLFCSSKIFRPHVVSQVLGTQAAGVFPDSAEILLGSDFPEDASEAFPGAGKCWETAGKNSSRNGCLDVYMDVWWMFDGCFMVLSSKHICKEESWTKVFYTGHLTITSCPKRISQTLVDLVGHSLLWQCDVS